MFPRSIEQRENMGTSFGNLRNPKQLGQQTLYESPSINCKSSKSTVFPHILHTRASVVPTTTLQISFPPLIRSPPSPLSMIYWVYPVSVVKMQSSLATFWSNDRETSVPHAAVPYETLCIYDV